MRARTWVLPAAWLVTIAAGSFSLSAQRAANPSGVERNEAAALRALVNSVAEGKPAGGHAWLDWDGHFLRSSDGQVYVPFTLTLDDVEEGFEAVAMYVRVVPRGSGASAADTRVSGIDAGVPVSVPERQFARGAPTAGEASARLGLLVNELSDVKLPFEGFFVARPTREARVNRIRRALVVDPGDYDLYVAVRERARPGREPKWAVIRRPLTVPNLAGNELTMSSIILAERVDAFRGRLSASQQAERPYALGTADIVPASHNRFSSADVLSIVFFVYNVVADAEGTPDVSVAYRFRRMSTPWTIFGETAPQRFSRAHTPPAFDGKAGRQLAVSQALPLESFPADHYEVEITVQDHVSERSIQQVVAFEVR